LKSVSATLYERFKQHIGWHRVRVYTYILTSQDSLSNTDHFIALVRSFVLPSRLGGKTAVFDAGGSLAGENERNPRLRSPFHRRFPAIIFDNLPITANATGVILCILRARNYSEDNPSSPNEYLLVRIGWPPRLWYVFTLSAPGLSATPYFRPPRLLEERY
jgi:hypothetical protein